MPRSEQDHWPISSVQSGHLSSVIYGQPSSALTLWAAGGDRYQDLQLLRADTTLTTLLGYELAAATTMRDFLEAFHVENPPLLRASEKTSVPEESAPLTGLGLANQRPFAAVQQPVPQRTATLTDVDATILETNKHTAAVAYEGTRGYQPVVAVWANCLR